MYVRSMPADTRMAVRGAWIREATTAIDATTMMTRATADVPLTMVV